MNYGVNTHANLICSKCGRTLTWSGSTWKDAEEQADKLKDFDHKCGQAEQTGMSELERQQKLDKIKEIMGTMRRNLNVQRTFAEECEIYARLLRTYKLTA